MANLWNKIKQEYEDNDVWPVVLGIAFFIFLIVTGA